MIYITTQLWGSLNIFIYCHIYTGRVYFIVTDQHTNKSVKMPREQSVRMYVHGEIQIYTDLIVDCGIVERIAVIFVWVTHHRQGVLGLHMFLSHCAVRECHSLHYRLDPVIIRSQTSMTCTITSFRDDGDHLWMDLVTAW